MTTEERLQMVSLACYRDSTLQASKRGAESVAGYAEARRREAKADYYQGRRNTTAVAVLVALKRNGFYDQQSPTFGQLTTPYLLCDYVSWLVTRDGLNSLKVSTMLNYIHGAARWHSRGSLRFGTEYRPNTALHHLQTQASSSAAVLPPNDCDSDPTATPDSLTDVVPDLPLVSKSTQQLVANIPTQSAMWKAAQDPQFKSFINTLRNQYSEDTVKAAPITPQILTELKRNNQKEMKRRDRENNTHLKA